MGLLPQRVSVHVTAATRLYGHLITLLSRANPPALAGAASCAALAERRRGSASCSRGSRKGGGRLLGRRDPGCLVRILELTESAICASGEAVASRMEPASPMPEQSGGGRQGRKPCLPLGHGHAWDRRSGSRGAAAPFDGSQHFSAVPWLPWAALSAGGVREKISPRCVRAMMRRT